MDLRTVPIGIQLLMGQHAFEWNEMMAMSVLGSLPLLVLYLVAQRCFLGWHDGGLGQELREEQAAQTAKRSALDFD